MLGVIGAGTMGNGIAQVFGTYGHDVVLTDLDDEILQKARAGIEKSLGRLVKKERLTADEAAATLGRIRTSTALGDLADAELVVEAVAERPEVKDRLFRELDKIVQPDGILASNTSSIWITQIASATKRPDKVIISRSSF